MLRLLISLPCQELFYSEVRSSSGACWGGQEAPLTASSFQYDSEIVKSPFSVSYIPKHPVMIACYLTSACPNPAGVVPGHLLVRISHKWCQLLLPSRLRDPLSFCVQKGPKEKNSHLSFIVSRTSSLLKMSKRKTSSSVQTFEYIMSKDASPSVRRGKNLKRKELQSSCLLQIAAKNF